MPTPTEVFAELAARYGGVDANDAEAVQRWFAEEVPRMPHEKLEELLEELLRREGATVVGVVRQTYPAESRIPALSVTPPATLPLLAVGLRATFWKVFRLRGRNPPP